MPSPSATTPDAGSSSSLDNTGRGADPATTSSGDSGGSGGIAGLPVGAFVGVVAAGTVVVAALSVLAAVVLSRRSKAHKAAASRPAGGSSAVQPLGGTQGEPKVSFPLQFAHVAGKLA